MSVTPYLATSSLVSSQGDAHLPLLPLFWYFSPMDHAAVEVEPKTPWWFPVVGVFLLLGVVVYLLTSEGEGTGTAPAASGSAAAAAVTTAKAAAHP